MDFKHRIFSTFKITSWFIFGFILLLVIFGIAGVYDILHPPRLIPAGHTLVKENIPFRSMDLITDDGIRLFAWYTPPRNGALILLAHGYGNHRPEWMYAMFAKKGYGVLAWDARAHGESDGKISTIGYLEVLDVKSALEFASAQPDVRHIGAWGGSMGGATIIRAAVQLPQIEALVVDSSFSSLNEEIDFLAPYPLINPMTKFFMGLYLGVDLDKTSPAALIGKISPRPVFIIQGDGDKVASPDSAQKLFNAAGNPRILWTEENVTHLGMYLNNPCKYQRRVVDFFDENLLNKNP